MQGSSQVKQDGFLMRCRCRSAVACATDARGLFRRCLGLEGVAGHFSALGGVAPVDERNRLSLRLDYDFDGVVLLGVGHHLEAQTGLGKA